MDSMVLLNYTLMNNVSIQELLEKESDIIDKIIQISKENNTKFEYLADASFSHDDDANAIVICSAKSALHIENIDVESKYHELFERKSEEKNDPEEDKKGFLSKLFDL